MMINQIKQNQMNGAYKILVGICEGKASPGKLTRRCQYNIKMVRRRIGFGLCIGSYGWGWSIVGTCEHDNTSGTIRREILD
jgi:hypothetical protein